LRKVVIIIEKSVLRSVRSDGGIEIWGEFCEIQSVYNDPYGGYHGLELKAVRPGLGGWWFM